MIPYCSLSVDEESLLESLFFGLIVVLIFSGIYCWKMSFKKKRKTITDLLFLVVPIVLSAPIAWSTMSRGHIVMVQNWQFDGVISNKFRSVNHFSRAITVNGINYEFIPANIWEAITIGDRIVKKSCTNTMKVNDKDLDYIIEWD